MMRRFVYIFIVAAFGFVADRPASAETTIAQALPPTPQFIATGERQSCHTGSRRRDYSHPPAYQRRRRSQLQSTAMPNGRPPARTAR